MSGWTIVECSGGALYSTRWVSLVSFKSVRLGTRRFQRCPVHHRFEFAHRVNPETLTRSDRDAALAVRDSNVV
jgi:hypothetical protein